MPGLLCGCTVGMSGSASTAREEFTSKQDRDNLDPLLDLSLPEEQELPFITVGTTSPLPKGSDLDGGEDPGVDDMGVSVLHMETKAHISYLETMLAVGIDGCSQIREILTTVAKGSNTVVVPWTTNETRDDGDEDDGDEAMNDV